MNFGTLIVSFILIAIVVLDIRYLWKHRTLSCADCKGNHCNTCEISSKFKKDLETAKKEIKKIE